MFNFGFETSELLEYRSGADRVIRCRTIEELKAKVSNLPDELMTNGDFQDVLFVLNENESLYPDRLAIRFLVELDPDVEKVKEFVKNEKLVPHSSFFVDPWYDIHETSLDDYVRSVDQYLAMQEAS